MATAALEHTLRDQDDFSRHLDYIHFNPVKHGYAPRVQDWPYSSFRRWVKLGADPEGWAGGTRIWGTMMGFAALNPSYLLAKRFPLISPFLSRCRTSNAIHLISAALKKWRGPGHRWAGGLGTDGPGPLARPARREAQRRPAFSRDEIGLCPTSPVRLRSWNNRVHSHRRAVQPLPPAGRTMARAPHKLGRRSRSPASHKSPGPMPRQQKGPMRSLRE